MADSQPADRRPDFPIDPLFLERWSPRAFDGSPIPEADLLTMFEAARWAPSAFNSQPWRFLYAHRHGPDWDRFLGLLIPWNQSWGKTASVLVIAASDTLIVTKSGETPSHSHSFDCGAAWVCLALQATRMGYHAHGMSGVDFDRARGELQVPDRFRLEAAIAIGKRGDVGQISESMAAREYPSGRKPVADFAFAGNFRD